MLYFIMHVIQSSFCNVHWVAFCVLCSAMLLLSCDRSCKILGSHGDRACQQSLCCLVSFKGTDLGIGQKPVCDFLLVNNTLFSIQNWTLGYFIISLLWPLRTTWKFPAVHRRCCLLWIWKTCLWFV